MAFSEKIETIRGDVFFELTQKCLWKRVISPISSVLDSRLYLLTWLVSLANLFVRISVDTWCSYTTYLPISGARRIICVPIHDKLTDFDGCFAATKRKQQSVKKFSYFGVYTCSRLTKLKKCKVDLYGLLSITVFTFQFRLTLDACQIIIT